MCSNQYKHLSQIQIYVDQIYIYLYPHVYISDKRHGQILPVSEQDSQVSVN